MDQCRAAVNAGLMGQAAVVERSFNVAALAQHRARAAGGQGQVAVGAVAGGPGQGQAAAGAAEAAGQQPVGAAARAWRMVFGEKQSSMVERHKHKKGQEIGVGAVETECLLLSQQVISRCFDVMFVEMSWVSREQRDALCLCVMGVR